MLQRLKWACRIVVFAMLALVAPRAFAQSTNAGWGSTPYDNASGSGVTFRVWAPNATAVHVPGEFNSWSTTAAPLAKEMSNGAWTGVWSVDVPGAAAGQQYKYLPRQRLLHLLETRPPRPHGRQRQRRHRRQRHHLRSERLQLERRQLHHPRPLQPRHLRNARRRFPGSPLRQRPPRPLHRRRYPTASLTSNHHSASAASNSSPSPNFPASPIGATTPPIHYAADNNAYGGPDGLKTFVRAAHPTPASPFFLTSSTTTTAPPTSISGTSTATPDSAATAAAFISIRTTAFAALLTAPVRTTAASPSATTSGRISASGSTNTTSMASAGTRPG